MVPQFLSWYGMYKIQANRFLSVFSNLDRLELILKNYGPHDTIRMDTSLRDTVTDLHEQLKEMGLTVSSITARRLSETTAGATVSQGQFHSEIEELYSRVKDELGSKFWLHLDDNEALHYSGPSDVFGKEVVEIWPQLGSDLDEAGKCFAVARYTASVFHLMRVMEIALRDMGTAIGASIGDKDGWLKTLGDRLEPAINALPESTPLEKHRKQEFQQTRAHLHAVRLAWRNDTMHPKSTYTKEEASELIAHVRTFLRSLARLV